MNTLKRKKVLLFSSFLLLFKISSRRRTRRVSAEPGQPQQAGGQRGWSPGDKKSRRHSWHKEAYSVYICKVLTQVRPVISISAKAMGIMSPFMNDVLKQLAPYFGWTILTSKRSRQLCVCGCLGWRPHTLCPRAPRPWPSTPAPSDLGPDLNKGWIAEKKVFNKKIKVFFEEKKKYIYIYIYNLKRIASSIYTFLYLDCNSQVVTVM